MCLQFRIVPQWFILLDQTAMGLFRIYIDFNYITNINQFYRLKLFKFLNFFGVRDIEGVHVTNKASKIMAGAKDGTRLTNWG